MINEQDFKKYKRYAGTNLERRIKEKVLSYTIGIALTTVQGKQSSLGSGTLIKYNCNKYILTANHILENNAGERYQESEIFLVYRDKPFVEEFNSQVELTKYDDEYDLCLLKILDDSSILEYKEHYILTDKYDIDYNDSTDVVALAGNPGVLTSCEDSDFKDGKVRNIETQPVFYPSWTTNTDVKYNYISYICSMPPQGFSGGGLWLTGFEFEESWREEDVRLAGVIQSYCEGTKQIKCIKNNYIISLIEND